jgi:hypothetical protein
MLTLASQFGYARGDDSPLRTALTAPTRTDYASAVEEHARGEVLVGAVIDGFLRSYEDAIADLLRIATAGTGVLQPGALHPDLVNRVAATASRTAERVTTICIRAFDYLPPVDVTFSDYLRALVTADTDLFPDDRLHLRANLIEGFRVRGIFPTGVRSLAGRSLRIEPVEPGMFRPVPLARERLLDAAREYDMRRQPARRTPLDEDVAADSRDPRVGDQPAEWARQDDQERWASELHAWAIRHRRKLGLDATAPVAVDGFFTGQRVDSDGVLQSQITVQFVQRRPDLADRLGGIVPKGGVTVVADGRGEVRYVIGKPLPVPRSARLAELEDHLADVEHRLSSIAWSQRPATRLVERLNLRSIDATRR